MMSFDNASSLTLSGVLSLSSIGGRRSELSNDSSSWQNIHQPVHIKDYPTMHHFGIPRPTYSMIKLWRGISWKSSSKTPLREFGLHAISGGLVGGMEVPLLFITLDTLWDDDSSRWESIISITLYIFYVVGRGRAWVTQLLRRFAFIFNFLFGRAEA